MEGYLQLALIGPKQMVLQILETVSRTLNWGEFKTKTNYINLWFPPEAFIAKEKMKVEVRVGDYG